MTSKHIAVLSLFAAAATTALVVFERSQRAPILSQTQAWELRPVHQVLSGVIYNNNLLNDRLEVLDTTLLGPRTMPIYVAKQDGTVQALAVQVHNREGYGGAMDLLVAIDRQGAVIGVHTLAHQETPGIGARCTDPAQQWLTQQFAGHSLSTRKRELWASSVDGGAFDQLTGATVTSRAITKAVRDALLYAQAHRRQLFELAGEDEDEAVQPLDSASAYEASTGDNERANANVDTHPEHGGSR